MSELGYRGVTIADHIAGKTLDEPEFRPFWRAVEELGAVVFFHQCSRHRRRAPDHAVRVAEHDRQPRRARDHVRHARSRRRDGRVPRPQDLPRPCRRVHGVRRGADGSGMASRSDGRHAEFDDARTFLQRAPSEYLSRFYYDSCTYTEATLRFLIDAVGDRSGRARHGLPRPDDPGGLRPLDQQPGRSHRGREGRDPVEEPRTAPRALTPMGGASRAAWSW